MKSKIILKKNYNLDFYIYDNKRVSTYSGIGEGNSAIASQNLISTFKLKTLMNIGTAGALSKVLKVNDLVFVKSFFHMMLI